MLDVSLAQSHGSIAFLKMCHINNDNSISPKKEIKNNHCSIICTAAQLVQHYIVAINRRLIPN